VPEHRDLVATFAFALAALLVAVLPSPGVVQALVGVPMALLVPGYALVAAMLPPGRLGGVERATASLAAALATTVLTAVALDALGVRIDTAAVCAASAAVTLPATAVAWLRRRGTVVRRDRRVLASWLEAGAVLTVVAAVATLAFSLAETPSRADGVTGYTTVAGERSGTSLRLTVKSNELRHVRYRVVVDAGRTPPRTASVGLDPGMEWRETVTVPAGAGVVRVMLYRASETTPSRTLTLPA
jgi:hypothetical protein